VKLGRDISSMIGKTTLYLVVDLCFSKLLKSTNLLRYIADLCPGKQISVNNTNKIKMIGRKKARDIITCKY